MTDIEIVILFKHYLGEWGNMDDDKDSMIEFIKMYNKFKTLFKIYTQLETLPTRHAIHLTGDTGGMPQSTELMPPPQSKSPTHGPPLMRKKPKKEIKRPKLPAGPEYKGGDGVPRYPSNPRYGDD